MFIDSINALPLNVYFTNKTRMLVKLTLPGVNITNLVAQSANARAVVIMHS